MYRKIMKGRLKKMSSLNVQSGIISANCEVKLFNYDLIKCPSLSVNFPMAIIIKSINVQIPNPPNVKNIKSPVPILPT